MLEQLIIQFDRGLRTLLAPAVSGRPHPDARLPEEPLTDTERRHAGALMRVNHSGEVSAQALYWGQSLTARDPGVRAMLAESAREEGDHLAWCEKRMEALGVRKSLLNPVWYAGSFTLGAVTGLLGDRVNMGFLAETERQVSDHLGAHLALLPPQDQKSRAVVETMKADEEQHAKSAEQHGAAAFPAPVRLMMRLTSRIMTKTSYWV